MSWHNRRIHTDARLIRDVGPAGLRMQIPSSWAKATGECQTRDRRKLRIAVWGWGTDDATAQREATSRLQRLVQRIQRGEPMQRNFAARMNCGTPGNGVQPAPAGRCG